MKTVGILLIVAGIFLLVFKSFSFTQEKKVVDLGPVDINKKEKKTVTWPYYTGGIAIAAGALFLIAAGKKKS